MPMIVRQPITDGILLIDFEANGLSEETFPTEVAWIDPLEGEKATSFLIQPAPRWAKMRWDLNAQQITGITREMVLKKGVPPTDAATAARRAMDGACVILSDAPEWDRNWMKMLFDAAGLKVQVPPFSDFHDFVRREFDRDILFDGESMHRAGKDVERLAAAIQLAVLQLGILQNPGTDALIAETTARNRRAKSEKEAGIPQVGIYWFDRGELLFHLTESWRDTPSHGGFRNTDQDHYRVWEQLSKHSPEHRDKEYDEVPRGRVIYREADQTFMVYGPRKLVRDRKFRRAVQGEFYLPAAKTKFYADPHYEDPATINWDE